MRLHTLVAVTVLVCALPVVAAELPVAPAPRPLSKYTTAVYRVSGLVANDAQGERLVHIITSVVRPHSWHSRAGNGTAEYFDAEAVLVVTNDRDVLREIDDLLEAFRRLQAGTSAVGQGPNPLREMLREIRNATPRK